MNLTDTTANLGGDQVSKHPGLARGALQSGRLSGVLEAQNNLFPNAVETLLTDVVKGLRADWLATSALRWGQIYPISELANPGLEKHIACFLSELFCSYSQLIAGLEMYLLEVQKGGVMREQALLSLQQLVIHPRDLASYQDGVAYRQRVAADINRGLDARGSASDK